MKSSRERVSGEGCEYAVKYVRRTTVQWNPELLISGTPELPFSGTPELLS